MILAVAATSFEMKPFLECLQKDRTSCAHLVTGVGPVETAVRLTKFFCDTQEQITSVLNFGIGGAYIQPSLDRQPDILAVCLAEREIFGDFGVSFPEKIEYLEPSLTGDIVYTMDNHLLFDCRRILRHCGLTAYVGTFVTVNAITGTRKRGEMLQSQWQGLCENMEGAAVARVCREFDIPCVEMRCISNMVEDRNTAKWSLSESCLKSADTAALLIKGMVA